VDGCVSRRQIIGLGQAYSYLKGVGGYPFASSSWANN
jgi:hypothetical protein